MERKIQWNNSKPVRLLTLTLFLSITLIFAAFVPAGQEVVVKPLISTDQSMLNLLNSTEAIDSLGLPAEDGTQAAAEKIAQEQTNAATSPLDILLFAYTVNMDQPKNSTSVRFTIPEGTVLGPGSFVNLHMSVSKTLLAHRSAITIALNRTNLATYWIKDLAQDEITWWKISLPVEHLRIGSSNTLSITTTQRSIEDDYCEDYINPGNWVRFDTDSYLHLDVQSFGLPTIKSLHPYYFDNFLTKDTLETELISAEGDTGVSLPAMFKLASAIGKNYPYKSKLNFPVSYGSDQNSAVANKIFVGLPQSFAQASGLNMPTALNPGEGFISVNNSAAPAQNKTLVSGADETGLKKAVNFFSNSDYLEQVEGNTVVVQSEVESLDENGTTNANMRYTLKDFGYDSDITLSGAFAQSTSFTIQQPNNLRSTPESYLRLIFRHSKALYAKQSVLTVYINNVAVDSAALSLENAERGELLVRLPHEALKQQNISIRVEAYHYLDDMDCDVDYSHMAWTVIDNDSEIVFVAGADSLLPGLSGFPSFTSFAANNTKDVALGIPQNYTKDDIEIATLLAVRSGQTNGKVFDFTFAQNENDLKTLATVSNVLIFGDYQRLILPAEVQSLLLVVPKEAGQFQVQQGIRASSETLKNKVLLQVVSSPWNPACKVYVLMYEPGAEAMVKEIFSLTSNLSGLDGQLAVFDSTGYAKTYSTLVEEETPQNIEVAETSAIASPADTTATTDISNTNAATTATDEPVLKTVKSFDTFKTKLETMLGIPWWIPVGAVVLFLLLLIILIGSLGKGSQPDNRVERPVSQSPVSQVEYTEKNQD